MDEPSSAQSNSRFRPTLRNAWSRRVTLFGPPIIVLLLGALMLDGVRRATANARAVERSYQVTVALERALSLLKDAETSQRGYVLTGDEAYLVPARDVRPRIARELAAARTRIASADQRGRVDALEPLIDQRLDLVEQVIDLRRTRGRDAAETVIRSGGGKALMDTVRLRVAEIEREQDALLALRSDRERRSADSLPLLLAGAVIISAILALLGNLLFAGQARSESALAAGLRDRNALLAAQQRELDRTVEEQRVLNERLEAGNQALQRSERRFRDALEALPVGVFLGDADGTVAWHNASQRRIWGEGAQAYRAGWTPSGQPLANDEWPLDRSLRGDPVRDELMDVETHGGERRRLLTSAIPFHGEDGTPAGVLVVNADVTERERLMEDLRRSAAELRDRADDEAALHTLARALAQALSVREVLECVASNAVRSTRAFGAYIERAEARQVKVVAGAGEGVPVLGTTAPYPGSLTDEIIDSGKPALALQASDIGESMAPYLRRSCERCGGLLVPLQSGKDLLGALVLLRTSEQGPFGDREVRHARALGDLAVAALRRVLVLEAEQAARTQAEAAVQTRDQVLRVVSHDLKNPVHTVRMAAQFLQETPDLPVQQRQRQLDVVVRATGRMNRLIMDLLDAARLQAGHALAVDPAPVRPADLLADVMDAFRTQVAERRQHFTCGAPEPLPRVMADRDRVFQVLSNLVGNAVKFTPESGQIGVSAAPGAEDTVCFTVTDTGSGIPEENLPHLFDPFWQASSTAGLGTGLGLAIARGLVEAHGGSIQVASRVGEGTVFTFSLPVAVE